MSISNLVVSSSFGNPKQSKLDTNFKATNLYSTLKIWHQRTIQRRQLAQLQDHILEDIGISKEQALAEASKPFWKQ